MRSLLGAVASQAAEFDPTEKIPDILGYHGGPITFEIFQQQMNAITYADLQQEALNLLALLGLGEGQVSVLLGNMYDMSGALIGHFLVGR